VDEIVLKLYITGQGPRSELAIENLTRICEELPEHKIVIIDVLDHPQQAGNDEIMVTPTLVKELPLPVRRIIGDLSDKEKVLSGLNIQCCNKHKRETSLEDKGNE